MHGKQAWNDRNDNGTQVSFQMSFQKHRNDIWNPDECRSRSRNDRNDIKIVANGRPSLAGDVSRVKHSVA